MVEYRKNTGTFEGSLPGSGLLVYRINTNKDGEGNSEGPPDEVYIFRPGGTVSANGYPEQALLSSSIGRTTSSPIFFSNGTNSNITITNVGSTGATISFTVDMPTVLARPTFNLEQATYLGQQQLTMSCTETGASIRYTTDGTEPTASSTLYTGPINISTTTTVKAKTFKNSDLSQTRTAVVTIANALESTHPYEHDFDHAWIAKLPGKPASIFVSFDSQTSVEENYDYLYITDGQGNSIDGSPFTGTSLGGKTVSVPGDTVKIRLISDEAVNDYGFKVTNIITTSDMTPPVVTVTTPVNNEKNVKINSEIVVEFSEEITPGSSYNSIKIQDSKRKDIEIEGLKITDNKLIIKSKDYLGQNSKYNVIIPKGAVKDKNGNELSEQYAFSFTTGTAPVVKLTNPKDGALDVKLNTPIKVTFNMNMLEGDNFNKITLVDESGNNVKLENHIEIADEKEDAEIIPNAEDTDMSIIRTVLTITPLKELEGNRMYIVTLPFDSVKNASGDTLLEDYSFSFKTQRDISRPVVESSIPKNNSKDVAVDRDIEIYFNETIKEGAMFGSGSINIQCDSGKSISAQCSISGNKLILTPQSNLPFSSKCTVTIPTGFVQDTERNGLWNQYKLSFTTTDGVGPIGKSSIKDGAANVRVTSTISITFNKNIFKGASFDNIVLIANVKGLDRNIEFNATIKGKVLTIKPLEPLPYDADCTFALPEGSVVDSVNYPNQEFTIHFSTEADRTAPAVLSSTPARNAKNVSTGIEEITLIFNDNIEVINYSRITLKDSKGNKIELDDADIIVIGNVMRIILHEDLQNNTRYTLTLDGDCIQDMAKMPNRFRSRYTLTFTTER